MAKALGTFMVFLLFPFMFVQAQITSGVSMPPDKDAANIKAYLAGVRSSLMEIDDSLSVSYIPGTGAETADGRNQPGVSISLYPNPATEYIVIQSSVAAKVVVSDSNGVIVLSRSLEAGIRSFDIRKFSPGLYIAELCPAEGEKMKVKFLKKE